MSLLTLLSRRLGVLLGGGRVLSALFVITFSMLFCRFPMSFGRIFVMLGSLIVFVLRHGLLTKLSKLALTNSLDLVWSRESFPEQHTDSAWRLMAPNPVACHARTWLTRKLHYSGGRTGRSDISAHIMDHISLMMIAGRQKKIGMSNLLPEINSAKRAEVIVVRKSGHRGRHESGHPTKRRSR
jgi:hypothetical protein